MRRFVLLVLVLFPMLSNAQGKESFSVEFGYQKHLFKMNQLNSFLLTSESYNPNLYLEPPEYQLDNGNGYDLAVRYQALKSFDFGLYGGFQSGKIEKSVNYYLIDVVNSDTTIFDGSYRLNVFGVSGGISSSLHIDDLLDFSDKKGFLKSLLLAVEGRLGIGFAYLQDVVYFDDPPFVLEYNPFGHSSWSGHGELALKLGYQFSKNPIISMVNVKVGYQYFASSNLKNNNGHSLGKNGTESNLDFSGLFFGVSLGIGK